MREVKPTSPCAPGGSAVPSELRLVAVVDGTPAVPGSCVASSEARYGAACGVALQQPGAETVDQEHDVRRRLRQHEPATARLARPVLTPIAAPTAGTTSASERLAVGRLDEGRVDWRRRHAPWVRADSDSAKASSPATASEPSAVAEARIEKSSEASTPV